MARQIAEHGWMEHVNLPTSSGKTSIIDIAVFQMALNFEKNKGGYRRVFFTVDRRFVVDEAFEEATALKEKLTKETNEENIVGSVARILISMGGGGSPLDVIRLRGGLRHEPVFISNPIQPTVIVSTVDQVGSRLLFRGYGISDSMKPVHAALVGKDSLIILDEAHLSAPFYETAKSVERYQGNTWYEESVGNPLQIVSMSATPGGSEEVSFSLDKSDYSHEILSKRFGTPKNARLVVHKIRKTDQKDINSTRMEEQVADIFADNAENAMKNLIAEGRSAPVVGIVVNSVSLAGAVREKLSHTSKFEVAKIIGRTRPYERDRIISEFLPRMKAGRDPEDNKNPLYVVATQTVEVGANIDFDALVSEIAPLDSLRQRFGRLNRLGMQNTAHGAIVNHGYRDSINEAIYGKAPAETWKWLSKVSKNGIVDFGVNAMDALLADTDVSSLTVIQKHPPVLLPAHLDALVQTSPSPSVEPDISEMLHGTSESSADVQVLWRKDIPSLNDAESDMAFDMISLIPPRSYETVSIPVWVLRNFLMATDSDFSDVEGASITESVPGMEGKAVFLWTGDEDSHIINPRDIKPGQTVVLPSSYGGYDMFGWNPKSTNSVKDIAEIALYHDTGEVVLRIHPVFMEEWFQSGSDSPALARSLLSQCMTNIYEGDDAVESVSKFLEEISAIPDIDQEFLTKTQQWNGAGKRTLSVYPDSSGIILQVQRGSKPDVSDDDTSSYMVEVPLEYHCNGVKKQAGIYSSQLIQQPDLHDAIETAGFFHDIGKADPRFQSWLRGGLPYDNSNLIAKSSGKRDINAIRKARILSGYPKGGRHECYSVALLYSTDHLLSDRYRDLVIYLVGTHHGRGRAMMPVVDDNGTAMSFSFGGKRIEYRGVHGLEVVDSGWTNLFWKMVRKYGYWGLPYMEMIMRLGDHTESEMEAKHGWKE